MKLSKNDTELFYKLFYSLLIYVNKKLKVIDGINSRDDLNKLSVNEVKEIRDALYNYPEFIDSFVADNPFNFSTDELKIISSWKHFVKGLFIIFRYLKNYTIFIDDNKTTKVYGVFALNRPFQEIIGPDLPVLVEAVLLPFKDKIIYDSMLEPYPFVFGRGIRKNFNDFYEKAKLNFGIITSLPFTNQKVQKSDVEKLKFYLKNERNREMYWEEIDNLINKNEELLTLYYQEIGKINARKYKKILQEIGITKGWFAIFDGLIIASGITKESVENILKEILPSEKRKLVYIFEQKIKSK
ncbi:MAG: hypothetical protein KatS3mg129_1463 [Leptospiraceae bacterium]|nr:MAG: hypothetical protein KatS3mg129_1463 [Leptospiraceae bacterium]